MNFHATAAAISAGHNRLSAFRKFLKGSACIALIMAATSATALADGKYHNADGSTTDDLEAAAETWRADKEFQGNWGVGAIKAEYAYAKGYTGKNIKIGIFDTGVDRTHSEFAKDGKLTTLNTQGKYIHTWIDSVDGKTIYTVAGEEFNLDGGSPYQGDNHGTHVGGIAGAARNSTKMHGVAFDGKIVAANNGDAGPEHGDINSNDGASYGAGFDALVASGVRVINNSWGIGWRSSERAGVHGEGLIKQYHENPTQGAIEGMTRAAKADVLMVFANGEDQNKGGDVTNALPFFRPEIEDHWVNVNALTKKNGKLAMAGFSDDCGLTKYYCISAPGENILSAVPGGYSPLAGTSMAAPNVSGSLAVLMERYPYLTNTQIRDTLLTTASHLGKSATGIPDNVYGWGASDLQKAMDGPGQFVNRFVVDLSKDAVVTGHANGTDVWSNDISDTALKARKAEEAQEVLDWQQKKKAKGWESGIPEKQLADMADAYLKDAPALLTKLAAVLSIGKFEKELAAVQANPLAKSALDRLLIKTSYPDYFPYASYPQYSWVAQAIGADLVKLLKDPAFSILPAEIDQFKADERLVFDHFENTRIPYLTAKLADPTSYDGGLTKSGLGTLRLTGDSTYSGDTIVDGGELVIGREGSITSASIVNDTGLFTVEGIAAATTVNKGGRLNVAAGGTAGDTSVIGGFAAINGTSGATSVSEGGVVSGTGTLESLVAKSGGTVSPGNSVGTLNVSTDATFEKGSVFNVEIKADQSAADRLAVGGTANLLGGVVNVRLEDKAALLSGPEIQNLLGRRYDILTAKNVSGKFDKVNPADIYNYIRAGLNHDDASKVVLGFEMKDVAWTVGVNTHNQKAASGVIETLKHGNALYNSVLLSKVADPLDFDALSGEVHASLSGVLAADSHFIADAATSRLRNAFGGVAGKAQSVTEPLAYGPDAKAKQSGAFAAVEPAPASTALWAEAYGSWAHADSDGNASSYSRDTGGFVTGADGVVAQDWRLGVLAGYGNTALHGGRGKASVDSYQIGVYGGTKIDALGLRFGATYAHHEIDTKRTARFGNLNNEHAASHDAGSVQVFGEIGYEINTPYGALEPFAGARHVHVKTKSFNEDGAVSNLSGEGSSTDLTVTTIGLRASHTFTIQGDTPLTARGMLGWNHAFGDVAPQASLAFSGGQGFTVEGTPVAEDAAIVEAGFDLGISRSATLGLSYTGQFSSQNHDNAVKADLSVRF